MSDDAPAAIERLARIMARLRAADGCEWDRAQTFATIAPYTIEEAYEVADAIARNDAAELKDELGDLLLQVVFHSRIAEEAELFTLADVATAIGDKMERRHPHIFGNDATGGHNRWEEIKAAERAAKADASALAGVALGLPALLRAEKLQKRAARVGFDWPNADGPRAKIEEELQEVVEASCDEERTEEIGDLLFAVVNWARHLGVDPEGALRAANGKFERRFRAMEASAGDSFAALDLDGKEALWSEAKRAAPSPASSASGFDDADLRNAGFGAWTTFDALAAGRVPTSGGVYVVRYDGPPTFAEHSRGGWFKGRDPSVDQDALAANWVDGATIVYIGKADNLRRRFREFAAFGAGKAVGHWGGRLIWQLAEPEKLRIAWRETRGEVPAEVERSMLEAFRDRFRMAPFANDPQRLGR